MYGIRVKDSKKVWIGALADISDMMLKQHLLLTVLTEQQNFRLVQIESIADDKINLTEKTNFLFGMGRKHCGKKEKMLVTSIFFFSHNVFKRLQFQGLWKFGLCGKDLNSMQLISQLEEA